MLLTGFEPWVFGSRFQCSPNWVTPSPQTVLKFIAGYALDRFSILLLAWCLSQGVIQEQFKCGTLWLTLWALHFLSVVNPLSPAFLKCYTLESWVSGACKEWVMGDFIPACKTQQRRMVGMQKCICTYWILNVAHSDITAYGVTCVVVNWQVITGVQQVKISIVCIWWVSMSTQSTVNA